MALLGRFLRMVILTKVADGISATNGTPNERVLKCPSCGQSYKLAYGETERYHLDAWLRKADAVLRRSHKQNSHETNVLELR
jgi:DNA-directed RNA polymerase subunit M/transcription elongation factor TFIIS